MKRVYKHAPEVPQEVADTATDLVERHMAAYGVSRAADLPEDAKVRLARDLQGFFQEALPQGLSPVNPELTGLKLKVYRLGVAFCDRFGRWSFALVVGIGIVIALGMASTVFTQWMWWGLPFFIAFPWWLDVFRVVREQSRIRY